MFLFPVGHYNPGYSDADNRYPPAALNAIVSGGGTALRVLLSDGILVFSELLSWPPVSGALPIAAD